MNGKVVAVSEEGSIVVIEEVTAAFENGKVIATGEEESEVAPSSAVSEGEVVSEAIASVNIEVNRELAAVRFDGTASLDAFQGKVDQKAIY